MKKIIIFLLFIFISIDSSFACNIKKLGKKIPENFKVNCYEKIGELNPQINSFDYGNGESCIDWNTFKVNSPEKIDTFISEGQIIPHKLYKSAGSNIDFKIKNLNGDIGLLKDNNYKTYNIYDENVNKKAIEIEFNKVLKAGSFKFNFNYDANYRTAGIEISKDGKSYYPINKYKLSDYDVKYINIFFSSSIRTLTPPEKIKISELNFKSTNYKYLIKTKSNIKAYSNNLCNNNYINLSNNISNFNLDNNTNQLNLKLVNNPILDTLKQNDSDNDGIEDSIDNCKNIYNPKQKDINGNGKGDLCSDDDKDGIIGKKDNCIYIYNPNQIDINTNGIGDKCEFDKDKDGIFDEIDNCRNKYNPNQIDTDNDGIGDMCDNSIYYNPSQLDKNNNGIGDITEEKEKQLKENDDDKDGIINYKDNCKNIANPNQKDSDNDGIGDICDNCINYKNKNQLDFNKNGIGDICEDSDHDGIQGLTDNCINIYNPDQLDSDNDGIGDICEDNDHDNILAKNDNCPYVYNPKQIDIDKDGIGDKCDKTDNRYIESNSTFFIGLLVFIVLIFGGLIFLMIKKLK